MLILLLLMLLLLMLLPVLLLLIYALQVFSLPLVVQLYAEGYHIGSKLLVLKIIETLELVEMVALLLVFVPFQATELLGREDIVRPGTLVPYSKVGEKLLVDLKMGGFYADNMQRRVKTAGILHQAIQHLLQSLPHINQCRHLRTLLQLCHSVNLRTLLRLLCIGKKRKISISQLRKPVAQHSNAANLRNRTLH